MHNTCNDRSKNHTLTTILILPDFFQELSIITSTPDIIETANNYLKKNDKFVDIKQNLANMILPQPYSCEQNVLLNFLEIIKLASSESNDCIAYYKSGNSIATYHNIASKSIAQLYVETNSIQIHYSDLTNVDLKQFSLWDYNSSINHFEEIKVNA